MKRSTPKKEGQEIEFGRWLFSKFFVGRKIFGAVGVLGLLASLKALGLLPEHINTWGAKEFHMALIDWSANLKGTFAHKIAYLHIFQAFVCLVLVILTREPTEDEVRVAGKESGPQDDSAGMRSRFIRGWDRFFPKVDPRPLGVTYQVYLRVHALLSIIFSVWFLYYLTVGLLLLMEVDPKLGIDRYFFSTVLDVWSSIAFFWLYIELSNITVHPNPGDQSLHSFIHASVHRRISILLGLGLSLAAVLATFFAGGKTAYWDLASDSDAYWNSIYGHSALAFFASILGGVSFALVVGCLSRRILNPGPVFLAFLYFYAMLQLTSISFQQQWVEVAATSIALPLKTLFWLVFMWSFQSRRMWRYLKETRALVAGTGEPSSVAVPVHSETGPAQPSR